MSAVFDPSLSTKHEKHAHPKLTDTQVKIQVFISNYAHKQRGHSPSYDEIAEGVGLSKSVIHYHITKIEALGYLERGRGHRNLQLKIEVFVDDMEVAHDRRRRNYRRRG